MQYFGNIIYDEKIMDRDKQFIIYGAGRAGRKIYEYFRINDRAYAVKCFCDQNPALWGKQVRGIPVEDPAWFIAEKESYHFIFAGQYADEIFQFLLKNKVGNIHYVQLN